MSDSHPVPSYAASIWVEGDQVCLDIPSFTPGARSHTVTLPVTEKGFAIVASILKERSRGGQQQIGAKAAPIQYDLDKALLRMNITKLPPAFKTEARPELSIEDLDL